MGKIDVIFYIIAYYIYFGVRFSREARVVERTNEVQGSMFCSVLKKNSERSQSDPSYYCHNIIYIYIS